MEKDKKLPHPKKVWKHLMHAVRSKLHCFRIPKTTLSNSKRRRFPLCSSKGHDCYHHHQHHHFPPSHHANNRHLSLSNRELSHNYQNALEEGLISGEALEGEEGENGNFEIGSNTSSPGLHVVDVKAQEFIENFYDRLKLERQHSSEEYFKMLARGT